MGIYALEMFSLKGSRDEFLSLIYFDIFFNRKLRHLNLPKSYSKWVILIKIQNYLKLFQKFEQIIQINFMTIYALFTL